jgi:3-carboxy-cis,cis-muconate cycloisomerase
MAHKRNPVGCMHALAAAARAPGLVATLHTAALGEHERALGGWQAELAVVPELAGLLGTSLDFLEILGAGLVVDPARMRANLEQYGAGPARDPHALEFAVDELLASLAPYLA